MSDDLKIRVGDTVLVRGKVVEVDTNDTAGLPYYVEIADEEPFWLPASAIHSVEPREIQVGDRVRCGVTGAEGKVCDICNDVAWVLLDDHQTPKTIALSVLTHAESTDDE